MAREPITKAFLEENLKLDAYVTKVPYSPLTREQWRIDQAKQDDLLHLHLAEAHGWVKDCSLEQMLWNKAWEHGHAEGHRSVAYWYAEFSQIATASKEAFA
jgi:hypothetical protein